MKRCIFLINVHFHDFMHKVILTTSVCTNSIHLFISKGVGERWKGSWRKDWILESLKRCEVCPQLTRGHTNIFIFYFHSIVINYYSYVFEVWGILLTTIVSSIKVLQVSYNLSWNIILHYQVMHLMNTL